MKLNPLLLSMALMYSHSVYAEPLIKGVKVGFFNGVWNSQQDAENSEKALSKVIGHTYNGMPLSYGVYYNQSDSVDGSVEFEDIAEVLIQKLDDKSWFRDGYEPMEIFWDAVSKKEESFVQSILNVIGAAARLPRDIISAMYDAVITPLAGLVANIFANPPTQEDYDEHERIATGLLNDGYELLFVAHSQGNIFASKAYETLHSNSLTNIGRVNVVHIAPPNTNLHGEYVLSDLDLVINGLRTGGRVVDTNHNTSLNNLKVDASGHTLINTYLNPDFPLRNIIKRHAFNALDTWKPKQKFKSYVYKTDDTSAPNSAFASVDDVASFYGSNIQECVNSSDGTSRQLVRFSDNTPASVSMTWGVYSMTHCNRFAEVTEESKTVNIHLDTCDYALEPNSRECVTQCDSGNTPDTRGICRQVMTVPKYSSKSLVGITGDFIPSGMKFLDGNHAAGYLTRMCQYVPVNKPEEQYARYFIKHSSSEKITARLGYTSACDIPVEPENPRDTFDIHTAPSSCEEYYDPKIYQCVSSCAEGTFAGNDGVCF